MAAGTIALNGNRGINIRIQNFLQLQDVRIRITELQILSERETRGNDALQTADVLGLSF